MSEEPEKQEAQDTGVTYTLPTLNHRGLLAVGIVLAAAFVVTYAVMGFLYLQNRTEINRINRIEHPSAKQFEQQLKAGVTRCLKSPECRKLFPALKLQRSPGRGRTGSHNSNQGASLTRRGLHPAKTGRPRSLHAPKAKAPRKRRPERSQKRPHKKHPAPAPHPGQGGSPPPPGEPPPLTITTQLPAPLPNPTVCIDHVARVNNC